MAPTRHFLASSLRLDEHRRDLTKFRPDSASEHKFAATDGTEISVVSVNNLAWLSQSRKRSVM